jgi:malonyl-CoA/methylmalonyl-CoA synthetase
MIFLPKYDQELIIHTLPDATVMMGVPTFYTRLLDDSRFTRQRTAHMRLFVSGSAPLLADTHRAFENRTGHRILERYGMTETNMNTSNPYVGERIAGTVGQPLPGVDVKIVDQHGGGPVGRGEVGMLQIRGPNVFKGYWRMPEKTKEEFTSSGFFITGDLATENKNGYISIVGRDKDMIISGGFNVYPREVELILDELPGIYESAVVAAPHKDFGEAVVAYVVADNSVADDSATEGSDELNLIRENQIKVSLQDKLAPYKQPKRIFYVKDLPRNAMGKVQKNNLREQCAGIFTQPRDH